MLLVGSILGLFTLLWTEIVFQVETIPGDALVMHYLQIILIGSYFLYPWRVIFPSRWNYLHSQAFEALNVKRTVQYQQANFASIQIVINNELPCVPKIATLYCNVNNSANNIKV